jgi:hypothetical protein
MLRRPFIALALLAMLPLAASAGSFSSYGPELGFSQSPDQFVVGGHLKWNSVAPHLDFAPGINLGLGDNLTLVTFNGDFHYRIVSNTSWQPYVGGGVGIHFASADNGFAGGRNTADSNMHAGGHFIAGATIPTQGKSNFFTELKLGFGDSPDLKAIAGWNFRATR